jgi:hypothetical protein
MAEGEESEISMMDGDLVLSKTDPNDDEKPVSIDSAIVELPGLYEDAVCSDDGGRDENMLALSSFHA